MKPKTKPPTLQDLFDQIREIQSVDEVREDDLTVNRVMAELKCGKGKARRYLNVLVEKKIVHLETVRGKSGKQTMVWRAK